MGRDSQDGLEWEARLFGPRPRWAREPSLDAIQSICRQHLGLRPEDICAVSFAFNQLYLVSTAAESLLMRVSLPVYPHYKTRGEVATLRWVRDKTEIPVPKVLAFQDSNDNEIGFEWILMDLMPGTPLHRRWRTLSMTQKASLTNRIAEFQAQLARCDDPGTRFRGIGTLSADSEQEAGGPTTSTPGQMVSHNFFMGDHLHYDVPRGPFRSSHDWLSSEMNLIIQEQRAVLEKTENEDDVEDAEEILLAAQKLLSLLPKVFPATRDSTEVTVICHDDLNLNNILVDDEGKMKAIVDWECVSVLPIWMAVRMPNFIRDGGREEEPKREEYADASPQGSLSSAKDDCTNDLDNEGKNELYWIHLMEYEVTQLQKVYDARLKQLWPDRPVEESLVKVDFFEAILNCNTGIFLKQVGTWVNTIEVGKLIRFADMFNKVKDKEIENGIHTLSSSLLPTACCLPTS